LNRIGTMPPSIDAIATAATTTVKTRQWWGMSSRSWSLRCCPPRTDGDPNRARGFKHVIDPRACRR
jgi:hypothetical protein